MSIEEILTSYGMSISQLSTRFGIPYRTVQNWISKGSNRRECPEYVVKMIKEILENEKIRSH